MAATAPQTFSEAVHSKLSAEELKALKRIRWEDRLTSLWAPITILACIFLVYLVIVESADCSYLWLQPPMQGLAVIAFGWWAVLVVMRYVARSWEARRLARVPAEELLGEVEAAATKHRASIKDRGWDDLVEKAATLVKKLPLDAEGLKEATKQLKASSEKHLAAFRRHSAIDFGSGFAKALLVAVIVRSVFLEPFKIPSGSMIPTLEIGDQIFVNKFIYGVRIPFTNYVPFTIVRSPKRGDIVVFNNPIFPEKDYIKRVIGVAGDKIEFKGREIKVNGEVLATRKAVDHLTVYDQRSTEGMPFAEQLQNWFKPGDWSKHEPALMFEKIDGKEHYVLYESYAAESDGSLTVPEGNVFVMGDNRDHSADGRYGFGRSRDTDFVYVPLGNIKGKAMVIWLPLGHGGWGQRIFGETGFRFERLFLPLTLCGDEMPRVK